MNNQLKHQQVCLTEREISRQLIQVYEIFGMFDARDNQPTVNVNSNQAPLVAANERRSA